MDAQDGVGLVLEALFGDILSALQTTSKSSLVEAQESFLQPDEQHLLPAARFQGHLLHLHRIETREPPDRHIR